MAFNGPSAPYVVAEVVKWLGRVGKGLGLKI